ncbi:MAG: hypothetical protein KBT57_00820 [bacterium]|nr:hypothetical protein [Candidatus Limimorpha equi]
MKDVIVKNISIGDELLIGQVINTNAAWLGEHLSEAGYNLKSVLTVGDSEKSILDAFEACMDADLVLVTGGLGPTADDITKPTVCKFFGTELVFNQEAYDNWFPFSAAVDSPCRSETVGRRFCRNHAHIFRIVTEQLLACG